MLVDGKQFLPAREMVKVSQVGPLLGAARTDWKERKQEDESQQGRREQWPHQQRSSPEVPKHKEQVRMRTG